MNKPRISVVVATYNRAEMLDGALETLVAQQTGDLFDYEIIVVDNASTDATAAVVERIAADAPVPVRYFRQHVPGDAPTRNKGVDEAGGDWLAFFDDDQFAQPDWLKELYRAALQTGAPIVGGAVRLDLSEEQLARLGPVCRGALREVDHYDRIHPYQGKQLPGCGNVLVARSVFEQIGYFGALMSSGGSDSDFFQRARRAGCRLIYTPHAVIRHRVPASRITPEYFRWDALASGAQLTAHLDYQHKGLAGLLLRCIARIAQAALVNLPLMVVAWLVEDQAEVLGRKTLLWRAEGYLRKTLTILAPRLFPQRRFYESLEFRQRRTAGQGAESPKHVAKLEVTA